MRAVFFRRDAPFRVRREALIWFRSRRRGSKFTLVIETRADNDMGQIRVSLGDGGDGFAQVERSIVERAADDARVDRRRNRALQQR